MPYIIHKLCIMTIAHVGCVQTVYYSIVPGTTNKWNNGLKTRLLKSRLKLKAVPMAAILKLTRIDYVHLRCVNTVWLCKVGCCLIAVNSRALFAYSVAVWNARWMSWWKWVKADVRREDRFPIYPVYESVICRFSAPTPSTCTAVVSKATQQLNVDLTSVRAPYVVRICV